MGLKEVFKDIVNLGKNLISDDPEQYVADEDRLDNALVIAMNNSGKARISVEDAALLSKSAKDTDRLANEIDNAQTASIVLHASDMIIRAKNGLEKWIKERTINKILRNNLNEKIDAKTDLPKDDMVSRAEKTNGKVKTVAAGELENTPRELGGKERESRGK